VASSWILFFIYQDDAQSNTHQIFFYLVFPHVACFTGHHLNHYEIVQFHTGNYSLGANYCKDSLKEGGVCIFVHNSLSFVGTDLEKFSNDHVKLRLFYSSYNICIRTSCKCKRDLFLLGRNINNAKLKNYYKTYCKTLSKFIKEAKKYNFKRLIENSDNKMKTIQDIAKLLTGKKKNVKDVHQINVDGTIIYDGQIIANSFNNYFLSIIGIHISVAIGKKPIDYLHQVFKETFPTIKYQNTTTAEIEKKSLYH
jgi:hypothetical protein